MNDAFTAYERKQTDSLDLLLRTSRAIADVYWKQRDSSPKTPTLEEARAIMPPDQYADMRPFVTDE